MNITRIKKRLLQYLPYILMGLIATKLGEAWRFSPGVEIGEKLRNILTGAGMAFQSPLPSFQPLDLLLGMLCATLVRMYVVTKGKNAKKYRKNVEYGSARWGTAADIEPYMDPVFENNVILTQTERLTMESRPRNPKTARNKNVLVIGGSGSGKTRFFITPNLMQCHSSYVVTDPKGVRPDRAR